MKDLRQKNATSLRLETNTKYTSFSSKHTIAKLKHASTEIMDHFEKTNTKAKTTKKIERIDKSFKTTSFVNVHFSMKKNITNTKRSPIEITELILGDPLFYEEGTIIKASPSVSLLNV